MSTRSIPPSEAAEAEHLRAWALAEMTRYFRGRHRRGEHGDACADPRIIAPYRHTGRVCHLAAARLDRECRRARAPHRARRGGHRAGASTGMVLPFPGGRMPAAKRRT